MKRGWASQHRRVRCFDENRCVVEVIDDLQKNLEPPRRIIKLGSSLAATSRIESLRNGRLDLATRASL